jgi:DNA-binding transcriptional LysR family regulator
VELRQLEYFVAVAQELHFGNAAARLHVAQPSVSQQIKALESELGVPLFERNSKVVSLTPQGSELLPLASRLIEDASHLRRAAHVAARRVAGEIRIGFLADEYSNPVSERLLTAVRMAHPRLTLEFRQVDFAAHHHALESGEVDVAFVVEPAPDAIVTVPLFAWPRMVAVSADVAEREEIGRVLTTHPVALPNRMMAAQPWRVSWAPTPPNGEQTFVVGEDRMESMLALVGAGRAICVVPEYVARFYPQPGVRFAAAPEIEACTVSIGALRSRQAESQVAAVLRLAEGLRADRTATRAENR